ncbi:hypothetical protein GCM10022252_59880 [Streptosporangium oxazolinicum]|uniref:Uncharacterized protein n=1 Tax=Streptosporangium oxazolinicum TaxID=909287 RepID=A0ABP8BBK3_9ACTN
MFGESRGYSRHAGERAYRAAVARAFATVPHYREMWADARTVLDDPAPLPASDLDDLLPTLYPFAAPHLPRGDVVPWLGEPGELYDALRLTGVHRSDRPLFEVRTALLDWRRLGPRRGRYAVLLCANAETADPGLRSAGIRAFHDAREPGLLGDPGQVEELRGDHTGDVRVFLRRSLDSLDSLGLPGEQGEQAVPPGSGPRGRDAGAGEPWGRDRDGGRPAEVLWDARLGYLGARHRECGRVHTNWRRVHVRPHASGPLFTALRRTRPTLVNIVPPGTAGLVPGLCPRHGTPVLVARGET